jgi:biopolymer transport protein ExbD
MHWKIRHEGSPRAIEGLTLQQVVEGLQDGLWEPSDEVTGPDETKWVAIENHPQLTEVALDIEPPPRKTYDDETRLDMTPLIDVTMVLLIFFILTTSYAAMQKLLDAPGLSPDDPKNYIKTPTPSQVERMITIKVEQKDGALVIHVDDKTVRMEDLKGTLRAYGGDKTEVLLFYPEDLPYGGRVEIQDAAKGAGIVRVHNAVTEEQLKQLTGGK